MQTLLKVWAFVLLLMCSGGHSKPLIFDGSQGDKTPVAEYTEALLVMAYDKIGVDVSFMPMPIGRAFVEANAGRLHGLRARIAGVEKHYPQLVPVPVSLFQFQLSLVADRRRCGLCDISDIQHVAVVQGMLAAQQYIEEHSQQLQYTGVSSVEQALGLLEKGRVDGVIVADVMLEDPADWTSDHYIITPIARYDDYHYLHQQYASLVPELTAALRQLKQQGEFDRLADKHSVDIDREHRKLPLNITAISAPWEGFSDTPDATYWQILRRSLNIDVTPHIVNWKRAKVLFARKDIDVLVGAYAFEAKQGHILSRTHLDYELPIVAIADKQANFDQLLASNSDASVCYLLGYDFSYWLGQHIRSYEASNLDDCFRMLRGKRVDMVIDYESSLFEEEKTIFQTRIIRERLPVFLVFHDTPKGRLLRDAFDRGFRRLVRNNQVEALYPSGRDYLNAKLTAKPIKE